MKHQAAFETPRGQWTSVRLPVAEFPATFRGGVIAAAAPLDLARARQVRLMIADRQVGAFALEVRSISAE